MMKSRRVLAAVAVAALALGGCAYGPTDAAIVDGASIGEAEIAAASAAVAPIQQQPASEVAVVVLQAEVQGIIAQKVAAANNVELTDATRATVYAASAPLQSLLASEGGRVLAARLADTAVVSQKVSTGKFSEECAKAVVVVNPRYGSWSKELCAFDSADGSLSKAAKGNS